MRPNIFYTDREFYARLRQRTDSDKKRLFAKK